MHLRVVLRSPGGETLTRDTRDGLWAESDGDPDHEIGAGLFALPGLIDAHAHLAKETMDFGPGDPVGTAHRARQALEAGVGLVLDKGWSDLTVVDAIDELDPMDRPEIEAAGVIVAVDGGFWDGFAREIGPGEIVTAVNDAAAEGRGWVKLIGDWPRKGVGPVANFSEGELRAAVRVAAGLGSRVAVHTMAREVPSMAVSAGVHSIEHGLFLSGEDLAALGARGGIWVPTVVQVEAVIVQIGADSSGGRLLREGLANIGANLALAVEAGVHVLTGTDLAIGSHHVAMEAIRLWEMGMDGAAVVDSASSAGFRATGRPSAFGVGDPANAIFFAEDPVLDPRVLAHPEHVIRLGRIVR
ncbi:MAG: amidohydrolase family protein [Acidimicrobiia bacterium]